MNAFEKIIKLLWQPDNFTIINGKRILTVDRVEGIVNQVAEEYKQGLTENKQGLNDGWIPCSERLPENYETVNITWVNRNPASYYAHIKDKPYTGTAIYFYGKWYWYSCVCEDYLKDCGDSTADRMDKDIEVIAWQPHPAPYKPKGEK